MTPISRPRRITLALVTLLLAGGLFRGSVAAALVTRGDDALRNGDRTAGVRYYSRALAIDAHADRAADRLAFALDMRRRAGDAQTAAAVATAALAATPGDAALLADRGFAEQQLQRWPQAERDFAAAANAGRDPRYAHLAGRIALRRNDAAAARRFFRLALALDPQFAPARAALSGR